MIDLRLAKETLSQIFEKIRFAVGFLAGLSLLTAAIVLMVTLLNSRVRREREYSLLRVLGASSKVVRLTAVTEYTAIALGGTLLAFLFSATLAAVAQVWLFEVAVDLPWAMFFWIAVAVLLAVQLIAFLSSRQAYRGNLASLLKE